MSAYPLTPIRYRAFDKNGQPLIGGQVFAYEAGGTTYEKDTYSDKGMQNFNTWPVTLDDMGSASIYISGDYFIQVFDVDGNLIEEADGIADAESVAQALLDGSSGGASDLGQRVTDLEDARDEHTDQINTLNDTVLDLQEQITKEVKTDRDAAIKTAVDTLKTALTEEFETQLADVILKFNEALENVKIKVGGVYISTESTNPTTTLGYGTWQLTSKGKALVGYSDVANDPNWTKTVGSTFGEYDHTLTVDEIPEHDHKGVVKASNQTYAGGNGSRFTSDGTTDKAGGGQAHNNVQPSMVFAIWKRTA